MFTSVIVMYFIFSLENGARYENNSRYKKVVLLGGKSVKNIKTKKGQWRTTTFKKIKHPVYQKLGNSGMFIENIFSYFEM